MLYLNVGAAMFNSNNNGILAGVTVNEWREVGERLDGSEEESWLLLVLT